MVTALRLFVAFLMLLSFSVFLYGYVHFTFVEHQPVGGAFGWAIIYACVLPSLLWPEFQWLWRKLRVVRGLVAALIFRCERTMAGLSLVDELIW
jgi:hypothetical protein